MAQTPDGYLWLGTEFGLFRFDGVRFLPWQPPAGQQLPDKNINSLLVTRDGSLWIGTFGGLVILRDGRLARPPALHDQFVASLFEDREGTVWAASLSRAGLLCAIRSGGAKCSGEDGAFGRAVWTMYEDGSGTLWAGAESGVWRLRPGPPQRYGTRTELIGLNRTEDGRLLMALHGAGLMQLAGDEVEAYPIRDAVNRNRRLADHEVNANKLLRDRDGGLWIGTVDRGLIHLRDGRADLFRRSDGLSGDVILSLFEDREGNVWVASTGGLDRFRELPVTTISVRQGLSSEATQAVLAATDGSIWVGAANGLTRLKNGQTTIFRTGSGVPDAPQSLYQDDRGRIWVSTRQGLAYFADDSVRWRQRCAWRTGALHCWRLGGQPLAFRAAESSAPAGRSSGRADPVVRVGTSARGQSYSLSGAECGSVSGATGLYRISRIASSARRTRPLMDWVNPLSSIFNSIAMGRCGPQP